MKRWKEDVRGIGGLDYIVFKNVSFRESPWGDVIELDAKLMEKLAAEAIVSQRVPLRGREIKFLRKVLSLSLEKFANEIDMSDSAVFKWEAKPNERVHALTEVALRSFFAERLHIKLAATFSGLVGIQASPSTIILKAC